MFLAPAVPTKVRWLYTKFMAGQGGILGDDMGLGKTVQSIALLASVLRKSGEWVGGLGGTVKRAPGRGHPVRDAQRVAVKH